MVITHTLAYNGTTYTIEEPIGFDDLKTKIKRSDLHGMSVEVSVGNLEFYGEAYNIIKQAYEADIDSQIVYEATSSKGLIYSGTIDLSTYSEQCGDYCSITCKVGDVGAKTTFNNRVDTDVDLNTTKTIDGADLGMQAHWNNIKIPMKHLRFTNAGYWKKDEKIIDVTNVSQADFNYNIPITPTKVTSDEFGEFASDGLLFQKNEDFDEVYGEGTMCHITGSINLRVNNATYIDHPAVVEDLFLIIRSGSSVVYNRTYREIRTGQSISCDFDLYSVSTDLPIFIEIKVGYTISGEHGAASLSCDVDLLKGSEVKMTMYDTLEDTGVSADMLQVHNALNVIAGSISENELSVKSDWYSGRLSTWNKQLSVGGGSLKAITNGYKIRGLFTEGDTERNMPVSWKNIINSLNALDCIGWGFTKENGIDVVRVERWDWFYKSDVLMILSGTNEMQKSVDTDNVLTDLQIGFKKYETASQFNSIDSVHGERSMKNAIKVLSKKISQLCDFIADTYSIEETRRAKEQVDPTDSFKYDENIFIFELGYKHRMVIGTSQAAPYIPNNITESRGVDRPAEQYNVQLSPRRCAERWRSFLFASRNYTPYRFISGKINYKASFACNQTNNRPDYFDEYLADVMNGFVLAEDAPIEYSQPIFKAELLKFTYPITLDQYKSIMANPYGQIVIDGISGWIKEMQYTFATGEAEFTLIPKYE